MEGGATPSHILDLYDSPVVLALCCLLCGGLFRSTVLNVLGANTLRLQKGKLLSDLQWQAGYNEL